MRASPRTWPSIRCRRLRQACLISRFIAVIYPYGVWVARSSHMPATGHAPPAFDRATARVCHRDGNRSRLRHAGRSARHTTSRRASGSPLLLLLCRLSGQVYRGPRQISRPASRSEGAASVPPGAIYTCPMHPRDPPARPGPLPDLRHGARARAGYRRRRPQSGTRRHEAPVLDRSRLALPVVVLEMGAHVVSLHMLIGQRLSNWIQFDPATPVVLWAGWPFFVRGWHSLVTRNLTCSR